jgi:hypothetical protein
MVIRRPRANATSNGLPTGALAADLGLQVAGFPTGSAVINSIFTQADFIEALAESAVLIAGAGPLRLVADHARKFFGHSRRLSRFCLSGNGPMVDGLAGNGGRGACRGKHIFHFATALHHRPNRRHF